MESSITERYPKQVLSFCFGVEVYPKHSNDNTPKLTQDSSKSLLWSHTDQPRSTQSRYSITWLPLSSQKHPVAGGSSRVSANALGVQQDPPSLSPSTEKAGCPIPQEVSRHTAARGAGRGEERSKLWVPKATTPSRGLQRGSHAPTIPRSRPGGAATK